MRPIFTVSLLVVILFATSYFYHQAQAICAVPLEYRIGAIDDRFAISFEEARLAMADAEAAWEDATERNLFTYDASADFSINFVFDERQALAAAELEFKDRLEVTEGLTDAMRETYDKLTTQYNTRDAEYDAAVAAYEARLAEYNATVARYNDEGGAPPGAFGRLQEERRSLNAEQERLNAQVQELNDLVAKINRVGDRSNQLIDTYNRNVETFNDTFGEPREFTQGDYQGDRINIYTFTDGRELRLVLAHELGHALSLDHTDSETAVMHYMLGAQTGYEPTAADLTLFQSICGASTMERIRMQLDAALNELMKRLSSN